MGMSRKLEGCHGCEYLEFRDKSMTWFCNKFCRPVFLPEAHGCNAKVLRVSCETCEYYVPPTPKTSNYPGDPMECKEPNVGVLMTFNPPVNKGYCSRWTPRAENTEAESDE